MRCHHSPISDAQQVGRAAGEAVDQARALLQDGHDAFLDHGLEQGFLAVEVQVERALRHPGACRDILQPRAGEAFFDEEFQCRRREFGGTGFLATLAGMGECFHGTL
jgi:hypothetical protein